MARTKQTSRKSTSGAPMLSEMKRECWQQQEQRLGTEEVKSQEQMPQSPKDTGQVPWHCEKSEGTNDQQSC